ncbi:MAG: amidohydrolase [Candidatus Sabulitectum sp.]|nr:amidohydrolase [Candidatus Sabulitectum sp.]
MLEIEQLIDLRCALHRQPEVAGSEERTAKILASFLRQQNPDELVKDVGGRGIIAIYKGEKPGRTVLLRCDMDALPLSEKLDISHGSLNPGVSHKCGHDGHMAIMCGVAQWLGKNKLSDGRVMLLFQPAEETGQGAWKVISQLTMENRPDICFALHNLPGFPMGSVISGKGLFAGASRGLVVKFTGKCSHAAQPEEGINPALAVASLIQYFSSVSRNDEGILMTLVHADIGEAAFGTAPGNATVMATLRAPTGETMQQLSLDVQKEIIKIAAGNDLQYTLEWTEEFPPTTNGELPDSIVERAAEKLGFQRITIGKPFPWSEDFGHFTEKYPSALFGLGAGTDSPPLHSPEYDFPDMLIPYGIRMFKEIIERSLKL